MITANNLVYTGKSTGISNSSLVKFVAAVSTKGATQYFMYYEGRSKTHQGGLKCKVVSKRVIHHAFMQKPSCC